MLITQVTHRRERAYENVALVHESAKMLLKYIEITAKIMYWNISA